MSSPLVFSGTPTTITVEINGEERVYELLCILDFNNVRKRMSVSSIYTYIILCIICIEIHNLYVTLVALLLEGFVSDKGETSLISTS
jgi:hypothetical protein